MNAKTHAYVFEEAWKRFDGKIKKKLDKKIILKAIKIADLPLYKPIHHFYNPYSHKGIYFLANGKKTGLGFYRTALNNCLWRSYVLASYFLGLSIHLLSDLAVPAHTKCITHYEDDHEMYLERHFKSLKFKRPVLIKKERVEDYFEHLARRIYLFKCAPNSVWPDYINRKLFDRKGYQLDVEIIKRQSKLILYYSISYIWGLLWMFEKSIKERRGRG